MRHRGFLVRLAVLVLIAGVISEHAAADPPDILRSYRFIPRHSRVVQTGGIAGVFLPFTVRGTFDLITGYQYETNPPSIAPYASFENVNAWMFPHSPLAYLQDLDHTFNMSGLDGTFTDPNQLHFTGENYQEAAVRLEATLHGRLLHLTGATDPHCCDYFQYHINALAYQTPYADFNFDGRVDSSDYTLWRDSMGSTTDLVADGNGDGVVDHADYDVWTDQFGAPAIDMSAFDELDGFDGLSAAGVPEPSTLAFIVSGIAFLVARPRRSRESAAK